MDTNIQVPLNLPDGRVLSTPQTEQGPWLIRVESTLDGTRCRRCGRESRDLHGVDAAIRLRHLPLFDVPGVLEIRPKRDRCPSCTGNPTTTQRGAWYEPRRPHTNADAPWAVRMVINATVADAARQLGVSAETIEGLLDRGIERAVDGDAWEQRGVRGIDEVALKRGHRDVVTVVTVPLAGGGVESVAVLADRQTATVPIRCGSRNASGSRAPCPRPSTPSSQGRCGRFANGLRISHRRSGHDSSRSSSPRRRLKRPPTGGKIGRTCSTAMTRRRGPSVRSGRGASGCVRAGWPSSSAFWARLIGGWMRSPTTSRAGRPVGLWRDSIPV